MKNTLKIILWMVANAAFASAIAQTQATQNPDEQLQNLERIVQMQRMQQQAPVAQAPAPSVATAPQTDTSSSFAAATLQGMNQPIPKQQMQTANTNDADDLRSEAFSNMVQQQLPLTPDQIQRLKRMFHQTKYAEESPATAPPKPSATSLQVNLDPGSTPPIIRLASGFVSSLVFLDSTGAPWPIASFDLGNPKAFDIQWDKQSNTLMVQATSYYEYGNLAVNLKGLTTPVMLTLVPAQKDVDYRVDLRIQGLGPNAAPMQAQMLPQTESNELLSVLDGVPPQGAVTLNVPDGVAQAWLVGDKMYLRTRLKLLSPGYLSTMSSADGMNVYFLGKSPLVLVSLNGRIEQLKIEGF